MIGNIGVLTVLDVVPFCLFNQLPLYLRNSTVCSINSIRKKIVPDFPC